MTGCARARSELPPHCGHLQRRSRMTMPYPSPTFIPCRSRANGRNRPARDQSQAAETGVSVFADRVVAPRHREIELAGLKQRDRQCDGAQAGRARGTGGERGAFQSQSGGGGSNDGRRQKIPERLRIAQRGEIPRRRACRAGWCPARCRIGERDREVAPDRRHGCQPGVLQGIAQGLAKVRAPREADRIRIAPAAARPGRRRLKLPAPVFHRRQRTCPAAALAHRFPDRAAVQPQAGRHRGAGDHNLGCVRRGKSVGILSEVLQRRETRKNGSAGALRRDRRQQCECNCMLKMCLRTIPILAPRRLQYQPLLRISLHVFLQNAFELEEGQHARRLHRGRQAEIGSSTKRRICRRACEL